MVRVRVGAAITGSNAQTLTASPDETVDYVLNKVAHVCGVPAAQLKLTRLGHSSKSSPAADQPLSVNFPDLRDTHTLLAVYKGALEREASASAAGGAGMSLVEAEQVYSAMRQIIRSPDAVLKKLVTTVMGNKETLDLLRATVPALENDLIVQKVITDLYLCVNWLSMEDSARLHSLHPTFADACQFLVSSVHAEYAGRAPPPGMVGNHVAEPNPDSDEDDDFDGGEAQARLALQRAQLEAERLRQRARDLTMRQEARGPSMAPITAAQLAAALAAAVAPQNNGAGASSASAVSTSSPTTQPTASSSTNAAEQAAAAGATGQPQGQGRLTSDLLQHMLQTALANAGAGQARQPATTPQQQAAAPLGTPNFAPQISQLHAMGFVDDQENTRALRAANGDLDQALELIISAREAQMDQG